MRRIHAIIEAFPEMLATIETPKNKPVPMIEAIAKDSIVQKPRTLFNSDILKIFQ